MPDVGLRLSACYVSGVFSTLRPVLATAGQLRLPPFRFRPGPINSQVLQPLYPDSVTAPHVPPRGVFVSASTIQDSDIHNPYKVRLSCAEHGHVHVALTGGEHDEAAVQAFLGGDLTERVDAMSLDTTATGGASAKVEPDDCFYQPPDVQQRHGHIVTDAVRLGRLGITRRPALLLQSDRRPCGLLSPLVVPALGVAMSVLQALTCRALPSVICFAAACRDLRHIAGLPASHPLISSRMFTGQEARIKDASFRSARDAGVVMAHRGPPQGAPSTLRSAEYGCCAREAEADWTPWAFRC